MLYCGHLVLKPILALAAAKTAYVIMLTVSFAIYLTKAQMCLWLIDKLTVDAW